MLINSKETSKTPKLLLIGLTILFSLLALKNFFSIGPASDSSKYDEKQSVEMPVKIEAALYTKDLISIDRNKIHEEGNLSLYLNNELGAPTLMVVYSDSISELQKNGRFLAFLYLKNPTKWRAVNKNYNHILLTKESLVPAISQINDTTRYIFKFRLKHPYFDISNLNKLEFVRHTREFGRFEEATFIKDSTTYLYPVANTLKRLQISMKSKSLSKITKKRNEALKSGILVTDDNDVVGGMVKAEGQKNMDASIRLKGDWTDHLEHPTKWSYRIIPDGENTLFGMRKFSVQHPKSRNYIWEWLFNKVVKDNDLIGLRYDFLNVDLKLTDIDSTIPMGIMALEESFDKILIENNQRREGLILGFEESMMWDERKKVKDMYLDYPKDVNMPKPVELPIKVYNEGKVLISPVLSKQFEIAKSLLVGLRDGKLSLSEAFDVDRLTLYIALSNLFGGHHGLHVENVRIYYNPVTNKLEPISFDSNSGFKVGSLRGYPVGIQDENFKAKLVAAYEKVSSQEFIDGFLQQYTDELNNLALNLSAEFSDAPLDIEVLQHNANLIKKMVFPSTSISSSFTAISEDKMKLSIKNYTSFPMVIDGLVLKNGKFLNQSGIPRIIQPNDTMQLEFILNKSFNNAFVSKKNKEGGFRYPKDLGKIQLKHHVLGSQAIRYGFIYPFASKMDANLISNMQLTNKLKKFEFIQIDSSSNKILFKSGTYTLTNVLYVPNDYEVEIQAGFSLDLVDKASIISYSPIFCNGTSTEPIRFTSTNNTGGGIFVTSTDKKSVVQHTFFTNLSVPNLDLWQLSGAVNFNEAIVSFSNCVFESNRSEDALNIIRTSFEIDSTRFENTFSDSFDGDFVTGSISNSTFINSGNDGIDISGSAIKLENITIKNPSDKGLSAGENSVMTGNIIAITDGEIGIVSKDLSFIDLTHVTIRNTRLGMACFQKKSEFGPGSITLNDVEFLGIEVAHLIEPASSLIINAVTVTEKTNDVIDQMYGKAYGKSSK